MSSSVSSWVEFIASPRHGGQWVRNSPVSVPFSAGFLGTFVALEYFYGFVGVELRFQGCTASILNTMPSPQSVLSC